MEMRGPTVRQLVLPLSLTSLLLLLLHGTVAINYYNMDPSVVLNPDFSSDPSNSQLFGFRIAQFEFNSGTPR